MKAFVDLDINILEINPMAITQGDEVLAVDAKISLDDNALFRHPEYEALSTEMQPDPVEQTARENEINFVRLGGDIGVVTNGRRTWTRHERHADRRRGRAGKLHGYSNNGDQPADREGRDAPASRTPPSRPYFSTSTAEA